MELVSDKPSLKTLIAHRFRGFLPVVIDVETGGFNSRTDALLEIAAVMLDMDENGVMHATQTHAYPIQPFEGSNIEPESLEFTGIQPHDPSRFAISESEALHELFRHIRKAVHDSGCTRAVMVAHNAHFDLGFLMAAATRCEIKRNPFHPFSVFDTVTLSGLAYGQTVLAKTCQQAGIAFSNSEAHSAAYDAQKTAELFCAIVNQWRAMGGYITAPDIPC